MAARNYWSMMVILVLAFTASDQVSAQALNSDNKAAKRSRRARIRYEMRHRENFHSPLFLHKYHPDWPVLGIPPGELGELTVPYVRTHRRAYAEDTDFRPWFYRRHPFSRRERWPYKK